MEGKTLEALKEDLQKAQQDFLRLQEQLIGAKYIANYLSQEIQKLETQEE